MFKDEALTSQIYLTAGENLLTLFESLTNTSETLPNRIVYRWHDSPLSLHPDRENMPKPSLNADWDFVAAQIASAGVVLNEQSTSTGANINFIFTNSVPGNFNAYTEWAGDHFNCYYKNSFMSTTTYPRGVFGRETLQAMGLYANAADPTMALYYGGASSNNGIHHDELLVLNRYFKIPNNTDMAEYQSIVTTNITNVMPDNVTLTGPTGTVPLTSDVHITYNPISTRDGDGERHTPIITVTKVVGGLEQIVSDPDCDGSVYVASSWFTPGSNYTASIKNTSGINGNSDITLGNTISFSTQATNTPPPQITLTSITQGTNTYIVNYNPHPQYDADGDVVTYPFTWNGVTYTDLNHTGAFPIASSNFTGHTQYTITGQSFDGIVYTPAANSLVYTTPNGTVAPFAYSLNVAGPNVVVSYPVQTDPDNDPLSYMFRFYNGTYDQEFTDPTPDGTFNIALTNFTPHAVLNTSGKVYDGYDYVPATTTPGFTKPNVSPPNFSIDTVVFNSPQWYANTTGVVPTDSEGDPLNYQYHITNTEGFSKFVNNNSSPAPLGSDYPGHRTYTVTGTVTDGFETKNATKNSSFVTPNTLPITPHDGNPNNVTVSYNSNHQIVFTWQQPQPVDPDNDPVTHIYSLTGNGANITQSMGGGVCQMSVDSAALQPNKTYTWKVDATDNIGTVVSQIFSFNTPAPGAVAPPQTNIVYPANNTTFSYDDDSLSVIYTPHDEQAGGATINRTLIVTHDFVPTEYPITDHSGIKRVAKSEFIGNQTYDFRIDADNGIMTPGVTNTAYSPNTAPSVPTINYPVNNTMPVYQNGNLVIQYTPSIDPDILDNIVTSVGVTGPGLDTLITNNNSGIQNIPGSRLKGFEQYVVTTTSTDGTATVSDQVTFTAQDWTKLDDLSKAYSIKVYPNPTNGKVFIETGFVSPLDMQIAVYDAVGKRTAKLSVKNIKCSIIPVDLSAFGSGLYTINLAFDRNQMSYKVRLVK
jgi:hypothetical protein